MLIKHGGENCYRSAGCRAQLHPNPKVASLALDPESRQQLQILFDGMHATAEGWNRMDGWTDPSLRPNINAHAGSPRSLESGRDCQCRRGMEHQCSSLQLSDREVVVMTRVKDPAKAAKELNWTAKLSIEQAM